MGEVSAQRTEWVAARFRKSGAITHSVIALARADSSPIKGEHWERVMANEMARKLRKQMTPQEVKLWVHLRNLRREKGWKFRRQVPLRGFIVDFACFEAKLIIELDGSQHGEPEHMAADASRDELLERFGFTVLRFGNEEIDDGLDGVWQQIMDALHPRP
jgi:very-short-patch-repair endonuclease